MNCKHKNVLVYGLNISGEWVCKLLLKLKANVFLYDDNLEHLKKKVIKNCYMLPDINENYISQLDFIVVSPSIEKTNINLEYARKNDIKIYSELEFASLFCKNFCAITGTNGKTTTTELINHILSKKYKSIACGNIGYPVSRAVIENKKHIKVVEVSSFMLENADTFSPQVATVLNIAEDHLIRHKTMQEYTDLKMSIFKNLKNTNYAIVNLDNKIHPTQNCATLTYSYNHYADVYVKSGFIYIHSDKFMAINEIPLKGKHNIYNIMCAICFALVYKVKPIKIKQAILEFKPDKYRIEHIAKVNGITFVNDSKSTNIASTLASVDTIKGSVLLLLGGSNKALNYENLFNNLSKRVKYVVAFGEIANDLINANNSKFKIHHCINLNEAFDFAVGLAEKNDTVLLSPASASYDQFNNYIERGDAFNLKVKEYEKICKQK